MKLPEGVTFRQVNYWISQGYIFPVDDAGTQPGRGHRRKWTPKYKRKLWAMSALRQLGFEPERASKLAEAVSDDDYDKKFTLGEGVTLYLVPPSICGEWNE